MNGNGYFGKVIEPGHIYEIGYEKCTRPMVLSGHRSGALQLHPPKHPQSAGTGQQI